MRLLILGAGQHGHVVKEIAEATGIYEKIDFLDDASLEAVGRLEEYVGFSQTYEAAFPAFGNAKLRKDWMEKLREAGYELPAVIHPTAVISPSAVIGQAVVVGQLVVVNTHSVIADGAILSAGVKIDHDCEVGICCHIDCGVTVASNAKVADLVKIEVGEVVKRA